MDPELKQSIDALTKATRELLKRWSPWRHFVNGVMSGIGATVGAAIVVALLAWFLNQLGDIDLLKPFVNQVLPYVERGTDRVRDEVEELASPTYVAPSPIPSPEESPSPFESE